MMIFTIALRELKSMFLSPLAWSILATVLGLLAYLFLVQIETYMMLQPRLAAMEAAPGVTDIIVAPTFGNAAIIMLLVSPLITMRVLSEEKRTKTLSLLMSAPVSMTEIVIGKYIAMLAFFLTLLCLFALMPLSLAVGTDLDMGKLAAGLLGLALLLAAFAAAGLYMSSLTEQPTIAAVSTFGLLLLLWVIDWSGRAQTETSELFRYLSITSHYQSLLKGLFNTADVAYYLLFIATFLLLSIRRMDADRLPH